MSQTILGAICERAISKVVQNSSIESPIAVFCSSSNGRKSFELKELQGSVFTKSLIYVLEQKKLPVNEAPLYEMHEAVHHEMTECLNEYLHGYSQTPFFAGDKSIVSHGTCTSTKTVAEFSEEQQVAKTEANALLKDLLSKHESWLKEQPILDEERILLSGSDKRRLTWGKIKPILDIHKKSNLGIPDLSGLNLSFADFSGSEFPEGTCFVKSNLNNSSFKGSLMANLDFFNSKMSSSDLCMTSIQECNFSYANLTQSWFQNSELSDSNFNSASILDSSFFSAKISDCNFQRSISLDTDMTGLIASGLMLDKAWLCETKLAGSSIKNSSCIETDFYLSDIHDCALINCNLTDADLSFCHLVRADLSGSTLTGVQLYGTARSDWIIEGVECQYVFWDQAGKERFPPDNDFEEGEFSTQYYSYPEFSYTFKEGITPNDLALAMHIVKHVNKADMGFQIQIDNFSIRGLNPTLNFIMVSGDEKREVARKLFIAGLEHENALLKQECKSLKTQLEERGRRADLAEQALVRRESPSNRLGLIVSQQFDEQLLSFLKNKLSEIDGLILPYANKLKSITALGNKNFTNYNYVALFDLGRNEDCFDPQEFVLIRHCLDQFKKGQCHMLSSAELAREPENSQLFYDSIFKNPDNIKSYVAAANTNDPLKPGLPSKAVYQTIQKDPAKAAPLSYLEALSESLQQLQYKLDYRDLEGFPLPGQNLKERSLRCSFGSRIEQLRGDRSVLGVQQDSEDTPDKPTVKRNSLRNAEKSKLVSKSILKNIAAYYDVQYDSIILKQVVPKLGELKRIREKDIKADKDQLAEQFKLCSAHFFDLMENASIIPADKIRFIYKRYGELLEEQQKEVPPFSDLLDLSATKALANQP